MNGPSLVALVSPTFVAATSDRVRVFATADSTDLSDRPTAAVYVSVWAASGYTPEGALGRIAKVRRRGRHFDQLLGLMPGSPGDRDGL